MKSLDDGDVFEIETAKEEIRNYDRVRTFSCLSVVASLSLLFDLAI